MLSSRANARLATAVPGADAPKPMSAPTAARPQPRPSACHSKIAAAGERRGHEAAARALAAGTQPMATAARIRTGADTASSPGGPAERSQGAQEGLSLGSRHAAGKPGQCRLPITGLIERAQHELGHVGFSALGGTIVPRTAIALPAGEPFLSEPIEDR